MHRLGLITGLAAGLGLFDAAGAAGRRLTPTAVTDVPAPLVLPPPLHSDSRLVAVAPGTWWENPDQESRLLEHRCAEAGWTLGGLPVGHGRPNLALPPGRLARLDGSRGQLALL